MNSILTVHLGYGQMVYFCINLVVDIAIDKDLSEFAGLIFRLR